MRARYPNIAATFAVLIALSTGAYAVNLARGSVAAKHLKKNAVTKPKIARGAVGGPKLAKNAVTSGKVKDGSLQPVDFAAGTLPPVINGEDGDDGAPGLDGDDGAPGLAGLEYVRQPFSNLTPGAVQSYAAACPAGKAPISGGLSSSVPAFVRHTGAVNLSGSQTADMDAWQVTLQSSAMSPDPASGYVYVLCATVQDGFPNPGWAP